MEEVFITLRCSKEGLSSGEVQQRTAIFGPNKLQEKKVGHMHSHLFPSFLIRCLFLFICCLPILKSTQVLIYVESTTS